MNNQKDHSRNDVSFRGSLKLPEENANELGTLDQYNYSPQLTERPEQIKRAKAEKRLNAKLRKLEIEQKAALLEQVKRKEEEDLRMFEFRKAQGLPQPPEEDFIRAMRERQELVDLEREQKEEMLRLVLEKRALELGDKWPVLYAMSKLPQYDHIPLLWTSLKESEEKELAGKLTVRTAESNEPPATS